MSRILVVYVSRYSKYSSYTITGSRHVLEKGLVLYPILRGYLRVSHAKSRNVKETYKLLISAKVAKMLNEDFWDVIGRCLEDFVKEGKDFELTIMGGGPADVVEALRTIISKYLSLEILEKTIFRFNVSNEERDRVIEQSDLLIYPPSTEGLGMPVFEAVMRGTPVLSAKQTALIEFIPSWIYPHREFRYPDFCGALTRAFLEYDKLTHHVKNIKRSVIVTSLANLKRLLRIL